MIPVSPTPLFATPLWRIKAPPPLQAALPGIAEKVEHDLKNGIIGSSENRSNFLGAQSRRVFLRESPYLGEQERLILLRMIKTAVPLGEKYGIITWINCSPSRSHNTAHVHPGAEISGVFYIDVPSGSGKIVFRDPRPQSEMANLQAKFGPSILSLRPRYPVQPEPGELLLFPSWLMHQVEPGVDQSGMRMSMALNISGLAMAQA